MKKLIALVTLLSLAQFTYAEDNEEWASKNASVRTTAITEKDSSGNIKSVKVIKDTTVYMRQVITEVNKPDKAGNIKVASRTTIVYDVFGGSTVMIESQVAGAATLVTTSITTTIKDGDGLTTTSYSRDKTGNMVVVNKVTSAMTNNGGGSATFVSP